MTKIPDDYVSRITQFHYWRPRFRAEVGALSSAPAQVGETAASLSEAFDLDTAVGVQLDAVGKWVGRDRFVPYPLETFWFSFDDNLRGWDMAVWYTGYDADYGMFRLADNDFRDLLYAQINLNSWDGTTDSLSTTLTTFYEDQTRDDRSLIWFSNDGNKSAALNVAGRWPPPRVIAMMAWPALRMDVGGVDVKTRITSIDSTPLFGFDCDNDHVAGWDKGSWGVDPADLLFPDRSEPGTVDFSDPGSSAWIGGAT